nr:MAG TPA: hypothetical protein [Caudoviricetes sp.]
MSNCFLIIPSFSELLLVLYEPTECTFIHIIVYFNSLGNIANCARQESRTPVRPTRANGSGVPLSWNNRQSVLSNIYAVLVYCNYLNQHCLARYFSCLGNFLAVLFALYCLLFRFVLFVDAVGVFVVAAQVVAFCCVLDTFEDIFFGIVVAFTGKHSLAGYFLAVNSYFSCFQHTVWNVRQYETIISVYFHNCYILIVHILYYLYCKYTHFI